MLPIERFISFGNTTRKPSALGKASKVVKSNGWIVNVVWSEVTSWDGSCENGTCGAGIMIQALTKILGGTPIHTKCGRVRCRNALDAELGGCGMLMENLSQWVDKSLCVQQMTL